MNASEAAARMLDDGELVVVEGPRRQQLATLVVDDTLARGDVVCVTSPASRRLRSSTSSSPTSTRRRPSGTRDRRAVASPVSRLRMTPPSPSPRPPHRRRADRRPGPLHARRCTARARFGPRGRGCPWRPQTPGRRAGGVAARAVGELPAAVRHGRRAAVHALRQHAERRGRAGAPRAARGRGGALVLSSGMGATACAMLALLRPGDHLVASAWIYGGTRQLFAQRARRRSASRRRSSTRCEPRGWRSALRPNTRAVFVESPVNPTTRLLDLRPVSDADARERPRARRRLDVREPDQLPPAGARRRRGHPLGDQVPERPSRHPRRRGRWAPRRTSRRSARR